MTEIGDLSGYRPKGGVILVRVTAKAARNRVRLDENDATVLKVWVTVVPEAGKANAAVVKLLARALNIPKSRLQLIRGATGRNKVFKLL